MSKPSPRDLAPRPTPTTSEPTAAAIADALATEIRRRDDRIRDLQVEIRTLRGIVDMAMSRIVSSRFGGFDV